MVDFNTFVKQIAKICEFFLVIGSQNSSNSLRLVEVAKNYGAKKSLLIEKIKEVDNNFFNNAKSIGITASDSAPEILVKNLIEKLSNDFNLNIIETSYEKEDVHFKIPQKLKEAI